MSIFVFNVASKCELILFAELYADKKKLIIVETRLQHWSLSYKSGQEGYMQGENEFMLSQFFK